VPISVVVEGAYRHDMKLVRPTIDGIVVARPEPTSAQPQGLCRDKGFDYEEVRAILWEFGFTAHIRARGKKRWRSRPKRDSAPAGGWSR